MTVGGDFYTTEDAARLLGVTSRRVRQMLDQGDLVRTARGLVDATSVEHHRARTGDGHRARAWAEHTAWGAVALLSDLSPNWMGATQTSRLRRALLEVSALELVRRTRGRGVARTYRAHPAAVRRLGDDVVLTDTSALGLVDGVVLNGADTGDSSDSGTNAASGRITGYLPTSDLDEAVQKYGLREESTGNLILRATAFDIAVVRQLAAVTPPVLTALDAATTLDPRERGVGLGALDSALEAYRR